MKKAVLLLVLLLILATVHPAFKVEAAVLSSNAEFADVTTAALAPSQRDINIAILAVMLGSILVGYERAIRGQRILSIKKRRDRLNQ